MRDRGGKKMMPSSSSLLLLFSFHPYFREEEAAFVMPLFLFRFLRRYEAQDARRTETTAVMSGFSRMALRQFRFCFFREGAEEASTRRKVELTRHRRQLQAIPAAQAHTEPGPQPSAMPLICRYAASDTAEKRTEIGRGGPALR